MSVCAMTWSPTGGTKKVMDLLAGPFDPVERVDFTARSRSLAGRAFASGVKMSRACRERRANQLFLS